MFDLLIAQSSWGTVGLVAFGAAVLGVAYRAADMAINYFLKKKYGAILVPTPVLLEELDCAKHQEAIDNLEKSVTRIESFVKFLGDRQTETVCDTKELLSRIPPREKPAEHT